MWLFFFLFWIAVRANAKEPLYRKIVDKAVLTSDSVENHITSIEWKHGPDLAMEWYGGETFSYRQFKDRGRLNISNGELTITGLTPDDSGSYTVEINNKVTSNTQLLVISPVSKPTVSIWCEPEMTYCVLTCNGNTTGAEPVTYNWTSGDMTWSSTKEHNITKENNEPWFSCAFENPVSSSSSEKVFNPFMEKKTPYRKIGDKAVLTSDSVENPITSIEWKHGPDLAMEWYGNETFSYRQFKDRGRLNISNGALMITGLTPDDSGSYTVEINNEVTSKTQLLVISPVSKPTLSLWCEPEMTYCVLTCNGDTTDAEPVTYRWTSGDMTWSSTKEHNITKENKELWFSCAFENPVSFSEFSEKVFNPFIKKKTLYGKIGDKAVLTSDSVENPITSILWKHGPDLAMEWYGGETFSYRQFKDRGRLNISNGALTITGLTPDDSGSYTVEINNEVTSKTQLLVISPVSKPTLSLCCEPEMTYCVLTCNGNTTDAEPVTYWWTSGDTTLSSTKEHKITKENKELWFSCAFENPVSFSEFSEKVFNPFIKKDLTWIYIVIAVFTPVMCIIIIIIYFRHKGIINLSKWIKGQAAVMPLKGAAERRRQEHQEGSDKEQATNMSRKGAAERRRQEHQEGSDKGAAERRRQEMSSMLPPVQKTSTQDPTSVVTQDTSNGTGAAERRRQEMSSMLPPVQKTSTQDPTSVVTQDTSNGTGAAERRRQEMSSMLPPVQKTSTQDPTSVVTQDTSNGTGAAERRRQEMSSMLPPVQKTSTQDPTSVVTQDTSNGTGAAERRRQEFLETLDVGEDDESD